MGGATLFVAHPASRRLVNRTRPAPLAAILALLALVCLGAGARAEAASAVVPDARAWTSGGGSDGEVETGHALALLHLRGGVPGARVTPRGSGPAPPAPRLSVTADAPRLVGCPSGAPRPDTLRPGYARALSAARDGTLSSRSTGVPPPALA